MLTICCSVLAQIYYFKPQTLSVSTLFLLILSYWFGNGMHMLLPSHGIFRWINPGPFNSTYMRTLRLYTIAHPIIVKEHVAIIIMSSSAAVSATAIQVISVQDRAFLPRCLFLASNSRVFPQCTITTSWFVVDSLFIPTCASTHCAHRMPAWLSSH